MAKRKRTKNDLQNNTYT